MPQSVVERYRALIDSGTLAPDPAQARAARALDALAARLETYRPRPRGLFGWGAGAPAPKGLYIHGDVGRGKSLLMDMFFESARLAPKRRVHFNAFMQETHQRIHEWRNLTPARRADRAEFVKDSADDPIAPVAKRIAAEAALLCFDEFQVTDVADAMILGRLFEKLFANGVVIVLTSNTPPARLYEGGLNRMLFLPFIAMLEEKLVILELNGPRDFRLGGERQPGAYFTPLGQAADAAMDAAWRRLARTQPSERQTLNVLGRTLVVPQAAGGAARFSFDALCGEALGSADYLALAARFHTLLIDRIPKLRPDQSNEARRFTLLIDTLYDSRVMLVCSAAAAPDALYVTGDATDSFRRTASRLAEMQSAEYLGAEHVRRTDAVK